MMNVKDKYTELAKHWLEVYLNKNYSKDYQIEVIIPKSDLSKLTHPSIKKINNYTLFDFKSDVLGILINKKSSKVEIVLLNRSITPITVKEIGEVNLYSILSNPLCSFIVSLKGLPNEVNSLLLNDNVVESLLSYEKDKKIVLFRLDEHGVVDKKTVFPRNIKEIF